MLPCSMRLYGRRLQPSLVRTRRQLRDEPAAPLRRHQGTGTVRKEHEGVPEPRRSRSRQALQLREEPQRGIARQLQAGIIDKCGECHTSLLSLKAENLGNKPRFSFYPSFLICRSYLSSIFQKAKVFTRISFIFHILYHFTLIRSSFFPICTK